MSELNKKKELLANKLKEIDKKFGKGAVMYLGDKSSLEIERHSTGLISLDNILGGGIPKGRIIEIYGPESGGKTSICLQIIAEIQKKGGLVSFIDAEHALDPRYAANLGVDVPNLLISQPDSGENALSLAEELISSGAVDLVVVDSVAALVPQAELDGEMTDQQMGLQARMMSKAMRKLSGIASKTGCTVIFINQLREKIGVMFGNPETTTGGRALKFYASIRIDIRKTDAVKEGTEIVGAKTKLKIVKNKTAAPFQETVLEMRFGEGFSKEISLMEIAVAKDIINKSGAWYSYKGEKIGQGSKAVQEFLKNNEAAYKEIENQCRAFAEKTVIVSDDEKDPLLDDE